jgi:hypothetical protein
MARQSEDALSKALLLLGESRGMTLTPLRLDLYLVDLADVPLGDLLEVIEEWRKSGPASFPQVPELRALVDRTDAEVEYAWQQLERWVRKYYHPDRGVRGRWNFSTRAYDAVARLESRIGRAMWAIGGPRAVWNVIDFGEGSEDNYSSVKRDFIEAWKMAPSVEAYGRALEGEGFIDRIRVFASGKKM